VGCFDNIPHGRLMRAVDPRLTEENGLKLIRAFLAAGSLEQWPYHRTYSGTPQGGGLSLLLCTICLHQLEEDMMQERRAHQPHSTRVENARSHPEYRKMATTSMRLRGPLKQPPGAAREAIITELTGLERQRRAIPYDAKDQKHPSKRGSTRYAEASRILVPGTNAAAHASKENSGQKLQELGVALGEAKTKLPHWRSHVHCLGDQLHGKRARQGPSIWPILSSPRKKRQGIKETLRVVGGYHHIPEVDIIVQMRAMVRGWCNYYRDATAPHAVCSDLSRSTGGRYAHSVARKHRLSMAQLLQQERPAGRRGAVTTTGRQSHTFRVFVAGKPVTLDLVPPRTGQIRKLATTGPWTVDLPPVIPMNWPSGRRLATRPAALERAQGTGARCGEKPVAESGLSGLGRAS
jgi:Group II intron, maturase-specific domain